MTKELQDRVWKHFLPKEFKEEVKYEYRRVATKATKDSYDLGFMHAHEGMFGHHNLTSDAEGEDEMLTVSRKRVQETYAANERIKADFPDKETVHISDHINHVLKRLFGSKCLPDELNEDNFAKSEPKPAEPKNEGTRQKQYVPKNAESGTHSFSHILKDDFRDHNRLHIAAMAMQGILSNADRMNKYEYVATEPPCDELAVVVARNALRYADVLIAECEKGADQ